MRWTYQIDLVDACMDERHPALRGESLRNEFPNNVLIGFRCFQELHSFIDRDRQTLHDCTEIIDFFRENCYTKKKLH